MIKKSSYTTLKQYELFGRSIKSANELYLLFWDLYSTNILLLKDEVVLYNKENEIEYVAEIQNWSQRENDCLPTYKFEETYDGFKSYPFNKYILSYLWVNWICPNIFNIV